MTAVQPAALGAEDRQSAPVIVLTYAMAGGARLRPMLSAHPALACTTGSGLLGACEQAAAAWRQTEGREEQRLSPLAAASVHSLAAGLMSAIVVRSGGRRWCEIATPTPSAVETFLELFPGTRFVCMYRACPDVIYALLQASPWGVAGPGFAPFVSAFPASTVAALTAWWVSHTGPVLAFERAHPEACLRVRYEDLVKEPGQAENEILRFLALDQQWSQVPELPGDSDPAHAGPTGADAPGCGADLPTKLIPPGLLTQVNELHAELGYSPLKPAGDVRDG